MLQGVAFLKMEKLLKKTFKIILKPVLNFKLQEILFISIAINK